MALGADGWLDCRRAARALLRACRLSRGYRHLYGDACSLSVEGLCEGWRGLPVLGEDTLRMRLGEFAAEGVPVARVLRSSGTRGAAKHVPYSHGDLWRSCWASYRWWSLAVMPGDVAAVVSTHDYGGIVHFAYCPLELLAGATHVPITSRSVEAAAKALREARADVVYTYPSTLKALLHLEGPGLLDDLSAVVLTGEPVGEELLALLREHVSRVVLVYGFTEAGTVGYAVDSTVYRPVEELYGIEVVDGRIVVTGYAREALPLVRYSPGDRVEVAGAGFRVLGRDRVAYIHGFKVEVDALAAYLSDALIPGCGAPPQVEVEAVIDKLVVTVRGCRGLDPRRVEELVAGLGGAYAAVAELGLLEAAVADALDGAARRGAPKSFARARLRTSRQS